MSRCRDVMHLVAELNRKLFFGRLVACAVVGWVLTKMRQKFVSPVVSPGRVKMSKFLITSEERNNCLTHLNVGACAIDYISEFQQKCRFALRKPPFYPLNYGDYFRKSKRRS